MMRFNRYGWQTLTLIFALVPASARTQTIANSFEELSQTLKNGQTVTVTDEAGHKTRGKVKDVSARSFTLTVPGEVRIRGSVPPMQQTFNAGAMTARWQSDGLKNGTLIGLASGAVALGLWFSSQCGDCSDWGGSGSLTFYGALIGGGIGSGVGALIDLALPHKELHVDYNRSSSSSPSVAVSPFLARKGTGLAVSMRF